MSQLVATTQLTDVTHIDRRGIGPVYRATISLDQLYGAMRRAVIRYSPRYQRGFRKWGEMSEDDLDVLLPIADKDLQISNDRAAMMAVKYLQGRLYTSHITWNARREEGMPEPDFDDELSTLNIESTITVPDTAHRHRAYYLLVHWTLHPDEIPETVDVDGTKVTGEEIKSRLDDPEEPFTPAEEFIHCDVYVLDEAAEGYLYDEFNADAKPVATAVAISHNPTKTPSRRFMSALMNSSTLFSADEVETRGNTIGSKSRKLVTNATLDAAAKTMCKADELVELEQDPEAYNDLVAFIGAFFEEWARHFPEFLPGKSAAERHLLRDRSLALSNLMFHPLMRLGYDLWRGHFENDEDWRLEDDWKNVLALLGGSVETEDPDTNKKIKTAVMGRDNPDWRGRILVPRFDDDGNRRGFVLSSTRQTRDAAYAYLREVAGFGGGAKVASPAA